jgi:hypothetical protein
MKVLMSHGFAILKMSNLIPGKSENDRMISLLGILTKDRVKDILSGPAVEELVDLQPPLETILTSPYERLNADLTSHELTKVRNLRTTDSKEALLNLVFVLKRVRNRRAHGFKTTAGPRDEVILRASLRILRDLGGFAVGCLRANYS